MIHYLAYGSNLHPARLFERVPSANLVGVVRQSHHRLLFHKKSRDGSGKCNLFNTGSGSDMAYGALYEMDPAHKGGLDACEGLGCGYLDNEIIVEHGGTQYTCFTYRAEQAHIVENLKPYHWYKELVLLGARYLQLPGQYISSIEAVASIEDHDAARRRDREALIARIMRMQGAGYKAGS